MSSPGTRSLSCLSFRTQWSVSSGLEARVKVRAWCVSVGGVFPLTALTKSRRGGAGSTALRGHPVWMLVWLSQSLSLILFSVG